MNLEAIIFAGVIFIGISALFCLYASYTLAKTQMLMESLIYLIMRIGEEIDTIEAKKEARKDK